MSEKDDVFSPSQSRPTPKSADAGAEPSGLVWSLSRSPYVSHGLRMTVRGGVIHYRATSRIVDPWPDIR